MTAGLPNLILLGAQKSGSTAVYDWLSQHPDIYGNPAMKDFPYFSNPEYYDRGLPWFAGNFRGHRAERYILHGYVHYLFFGREIARRLQDFNPESRLIMLLRNPVDRAFSGWLQARKTGNESTESFAEAIQADRLGQLTNLRARVDRSYLTHGLYARQIQEYLEVFPRQQIHIELYDSIQDDPAAACTKLFKFLGISSDFQPQLRKKNVYGKPRFPAIESLIQRGIPSRLLHKIVPLSLRSRLRQQVRALNTIAVAKPQLDAGLRAELENYYAQDILRLQEITGRNLQHWLPTAPDGVSEAKP